MGEGRSDAKLSYHLNLLAKTWDGFQLNKEFSMENHFVRIFRVFRLSIHLLRSILYNALERKRARVLLTSPLNVTFTKILSMRTAPTQVKWSEQ